jgi:multiple sugar transport system permease protein
MVVPVASVVLVFQVLFDFNGVASEMLQFFGLQKIDWMKSNWGPVVVLVLFMWKNLGYNMILFLGALGNIPKDALEVAYLDTNSAWTIFWKIKIHYLSPTLLFVTIISLINSFKTFREVYLLTGSYPFHTMYILQHYMNNMFDSMDYQKLSSAAILMSIVMTLIILGLYIAENRFGRDMEE